MSHELADFEPSTGHLHTCPNNRPGSPAYIYCDCAHRLYGMAATIPEPPETTRTMPNKPQSPETILNDHLDACLQPAADGPIPGVDGRSILYVLEIHGYGVYRNELDDSARAYLDRIEAEAPRPLIIRLNPGTGIDDISRQLDQLRAATDLAADGVLIIPGVDPH